MNKPTLAERIMATFLEEMDERIGDMNRGLLALEKSGQDSNDEEIAVLFRSAHSLKGAAGAANVEVITSACHQMEDILGDVREGLRGFPPSLATLMLSAVDGIEEVGVRLRAGEKLDDAPLHDVIPLLEEANQSAEAPAATESTPPVDQLATDDETPPETTPTGSTEPAATEPAESTEPAAAGTATAAAASAGTEPPSTLDRRATVSPTIRVPAEKLDSLLAQSGELLVARRRVEFRAGDAAMLSDTFTSIRKLWAALERPLRKINDGGAGGARVAELVDQASDQMSRFSKQLDRLASSMIVDSRLLGQTCDSLDDEVYRARMLPFEQACGGLARAVRDIARATGKQVELVMQGQDVEVDRSVLEGLKDPLLHLVRNAVDHGIEPAEERLLAGKPAVATVTVSAALRGGQVEVVVSDDGGGFNLERIRAKAARQNLPVPEDDTEAARLVFTPGFSTAPIVTDVSGRGVGLDVVQSQIEELHGAVDLSFVRGAGSRFSLTVPLTLTTIRCTLVASAGQQYAIPTAAVQQIVRFDPSDLRSISGSNLLVLGEEPTPATTLSSALGLPDTQHYQGGKLLAVVLCTGDQRVALIVEDITTEQEMLVKNLGVRIRRVKHVSGATLLPSGEIALVLNAPNVIRSAAAMRGHGGLKPAEESKPGKVQRRVLAVDDSLTTRTLLKSILETAGYAVTMAVDGQHGWELLQSGEFDIIVTDVDMPRMDGFQLTSAVRGSAAHAALPVVLCTARGSNADKSHGIQVGASAYIVKSGFDQANLLEVIEQLI